jgi:4-hydroxybenzoate polyprenyltransferase
MLESLILVALVVLFGVGYSTRSYLGALVPGAVVVWAAIAYAQRTPTDDEVGVLPAIFLVASIVGLLVFLGGVALGRRSRLTPSSNGT